MGNLQHNLNQLSDPNGYRYDFGEYFYSRVESFPHLHVVRCGRLPEHEPRPQPRMNEPQNRPGTLPSLAQVPFVPGKHHPASYLTIEQVAEILVVSPETVRRQFSHLEGVIDLGTSETMYKRKRRVLRIPRTTLDAFLRSKQVKMKRAA